MRRLLVPVLALAGAAPAAADDLVLAPAPGATGLDAGAGSLVWSAPVEGRWALMHFRAGVATQLPIPTRATPFDADIGTDRDGQPTAVYSRCAGETGDGCSIYALTLDPLGAERRVGDLDYRGQAAAETEPAVHRGAIAYSSRRGDEPFPRVLLRAANGHVRELSGGSRRGEGDRATVQDTDLGPGGAAYVWRMSRGPDQIASDFIEMRFAPASGRMSVLIGTGTVDQQCGEEGVSAPTVSARRVDYLADAGCATRTEFAGYDLTTGYFMTSPMSAFAYGHAGGGGARFWLRTRQGTVGAPCCELMLSTGVALVNRRRVGGPLRYGIEEIPGHRWVSGLRGTRVLRPPARVECIPRRGGVLVSVGHIFNHRRLGRCNRTYHLRAGGRTFKVRVLAP